MTGDLLGCIRPLTAVQYDCSTYRICPGEFCIVIADESVGSTYDVATVTVLLSAGNPVQMTDWCLTYYWRVTCTVK